MFLDEILVAFAHWRETLLDPHVQRGSVHACAFGCECVILFDPIVHLRLRQVVRLHELVILDVDRIILVRQLYGKAGHRLDQIAQRGRLIRGQQG